MKVALRSAPKISGSKTLHNKRWSGKSEGLAAEEHGDIGEGRGPVVLRGMSVMAERLDVKTDRVALLWTGEINEGRPKDEFEHSVGMVERGGAVGDAVQKLFVAVARDKKGAVARKKIDVAGEGDGSLLRSMVQVEMQMSELALRIGIVGTPDNNWPGIALDGEEGRALRVKRAECMEERRMLGRLGEMVKVVGILTEVDELDGRIVGIRPGNNENGIIGAALGGPVGEHD